MSFYSRNEPCPCGSGRKYKKCCWSVDTSLTPQDIAEQPGDVADLFADPIERELFLMQGDVEITDDLIRELTGKGWNEAELRRAQEDGLIYNRLTNKLINS